jgi:hypothetical protein
MGWIPVLLGVHAAGGWTICAGARGGEEQAPASACVVLLPTSILLQCSLLVNIHVLIPLIYLL